MITHAVLFKLFEGVTADSEAGRRFHEAMLALPGKIEEIREWHCGFNVTSDSEAYDYVLVARFESKAALHRYFDHPAHLELLAMLGTVAKLRFGDIEDAKPMVS